MARQSRQLFTEALRRVECDTFKRAGEDVLIGTLSYDKDHRKGRGYYLTVYKTLVSDDGICSTVLGQDPYEQLLLLPTKAFSAKVFESLTATSEQIQELKDRCMVRVHATWAKEKKEVVA